MDYEKKYKEALELARDYYKANLKLDEVDENLVLKDIFPELKESEDERIRHAIDGALQNKTSIEYLNALGITFQNAHNWLEKQGEQSDEWKEGDIVRHGGILALVINGRNAMKSNCERITIQYPNEWVKAEPKEREHFFEKLEKQEQKFDSIVQIPDGCHAYIKDRKIYIENYTKI